MQDSDIIALYFARAESAVAETAKKYGAYLNAVTYNILRSHEDAEECVADTYIAAWNAIPPACPHVLRHFLARIARSRACDRLDYLTARCRTSDAAVRLDELSECVPDSSGSAEEAWELRRIGEVLNTFLATLDSADCAVFVSRYYYGRSIKETAARLGVTERRVKYRLARVRAALKEHLEREGVQL